MGLKMVERVPLLCGIHSEFDLHNSVFKLNEGVRKIASMGYKAVMILDPQPVGWIKFIRVCKSSGIKPIIALPFRGDFLVALDTVGLFELYRIFNGLIEPQDAKHVERISLPAWHVRYANPSEKLGLELLALLGSHEMLEGAHVPWPAEYVQFLQKNGAELATLFKLEDEVQEYHPKLEHAFPVVATREELAKECVHFLQSAGKLNDVYLRRLHRELEEMENAGILNYIATIRKVVQTCKNLDAQVGPGRGSAVGSLVCYALGITHVDPVEHSLLFERFLNRARRELPDIDIDVEDRRRQEVIEALKKDFGRFSVLNILTFGTLGERLLKSEIQRVRRNLKRPLSVDGRTLQLLLGLPYHKSSHAAGLIVSKADLRTVTPVDVENELLLMDMEDLEEIGLVKIDLLGLRTLSFLRDVSESVGISEDTVPLDDERAYDVLAQGLTAGVFQLESRQATLLAISLSPRNLDELSDLIALNRPGPIQSGMVDEYIHHKHQEKTVYLHPSLEKILSRTRGTLIYQEQVIELAMEVAGFSAEDADVLRRAMAKKDAKLLAKLRPRFIEGAMNYGLSKEASNMLFDWIYNFAGYAFNRSHSIAYAHLTYLAAYLKAHATREFYRTYLIQNAGEGAKCWRALNEVRYLGMRVLGVEESRANEEGIRVPVECVKGIGPQTASTVASILGSDEGFEEMVNQLNRSGVHLRLLENLIKAGTFDERINTRKGAIKKLRRVAEGLTEPVITLQRALFGIVDETDSEGEGEESPDDKMLMELESLGFPVTLPIPSTDLERFRDANLCEISIKFSRGVVPFRCVRWNKMSVISDGNCAIAIKSELPSSGVAFLDFSSRNVLKCFAENPERVERIYKHSITPEEIVPAPDGNVVVIPARGSRIVVNGAIAKLPDEVSFY